MNSFSKKLTSPLLPALLLGFALSGCSNNSNEPIAQVDPPLPKNFVFQVEVTNLTNNQPLSPIALIAHKEGDLWTIGSAASTELELLAEGGDNSGILASSFAMDNVGGMAPVGPGGRDTLSITITDSIDATFLSVATMLVNTNDAFSGMNRLDISGFAVGDSKMMTAAAYDAGTEANSEMMGTIPGPADGGEGMNTARDDVDFVSLHSGVVTADFGLTGSILNESHRFDNPVVQIKVTRME